MDQQIHNIKVVHPTSTYPLVPLGGGGFIFNYPPLYTTAPLVPFSQPAMAVPQSIVSPPSSPVSVPSSPISSPIAPSASPVSFMTQLDANTVRKEKLEKYRQKRTKRNYNRPADQARRERAQARVRDELGHFVASPKTLDSEKEKMLEEMDDVKNQLEAWRKESQMLKDRLSAVEQKLAEQQQLNSKLLHENRLLWSSVPRSDVFNTLNPEASYADAFKEKVDFANIELNWTDSPLLNELIGSSDEKCERFGPVDPYYVAGSLS